MTFRCNICGTHIDETMVSCPACGEPINEYAYDPFGYRRKGDKALKNDNLNEAYAWYKHAALKNLAYGFCGMADCYRIAYNMNRVIFHDKDHEQYLQKARYLYYKALDLSPDNATYQFRTIYIQTECAEEYFSDMSVYDHLLKMSERCEAIQGYENDIFAVMTIAKACATRSPDDMKIWYQHVLNMENFTAPDFKLAAYMELANLALYGLTVLDIPSVEDIEKGKYYLQCANKLGAQIDIDSIISAVEENCSKELFDQELRRERQENDKYHYTHQYVDKYDDDDYDEDWINSAEYEKRLNEEDESENYVACDMEGNIIYSSSNSSRSSKDRPFDIDPDNLDVSTGDYESSEDYLKDRFEWL